MGKAVPQEVGRMKVLWTNPTPGNNFAAQTVTVKGLSDYKYICISLKRTTGTNQEHFVFLECDHGSECIGQVSYNTFMVREFFSFKNNETVSFQDCHRGSSIDNSLLIPYQIYGIG